MHQRHEITRKSNFILIAQSRRRAGYRSSPAQGARGKRSSREHGINATQRQARASREEASKRPLLRRRPSATTEGEATMIQRRNGSSRRELQRRSGSSRRELQRRSGSSRRELQQRSGSSRRELQQSKQERLSFHRMPQPPHA